MVIFHSYVMLVYQRVFCLLNITGFPVAKLLPVQGGAPTVMLAVNQQTKQFQHGHQNPWFSG